MERTIVCVGPSTSGRSEEVRFDELRAIVRLLSELSDLTPGAERRTHALIGLARIVGAQVGMWIDLEEVSSRRGPSLRLRDAIDVGWAGERERDVFRSYLHGEQVRSVDPSLGPIAEAMRRSFVAGTRAEVLADRDWYRSPHVQEFRRAAGVDSFIYVGRRPRAGARADCLSLHRPWGERAFSPRERRVVETFFHESARILGPAPARTGAAIEADLPPRLRDTLRGLARGLGEKQLAAELGISQHTVHEYVKALYRRAGVSSRAELLARVLGAG
jgi:DNA-binding CsgD family transcriptional regulator